jgi:LysM repeat protein
MIKSELLEEKYRVQKKLAKESATAKEYLKRSHMTAEKISKRYGFSLNYIELHNNASDTEGNSAALHHDILRDV